MKTTTALSMASLLLMGASATAQTSVPPEPYIVHDTCAVCHGENGVSPRARFPNLAAQTQEYLDAQLKSFRDRTRAGPDAEAYMWSIAHSLSDATINEIAEYYVALPPAASSGGENPAQIAAGKDIYDNGITSENVPACGVCHGASGEGLTMFPRLAGQHPDYIVAQLQLYRSKERENAIMNANVENMTDEQIRDVAAYLASL